VLEALLIWVSVESGERIQRHSRWPAYAECIGQRDIHRLAGRWAECLRLPTAGAMREPLGREHLRMTNLVEAISSLSELAARKADQYDQDAEEIETQVGLDLLRIREAEGQAKEYRDAARSLRLEADLPTQADINRAGTRALARIHHCRSTGE
jgi:hypothetical protein